MPELPEVQTTINGLNQKVLLRTFVDVWSDWGKIVRLRSSFDGATAGQVKKPKDFEQFKKEIKNKKIKKIWRRAKNIIFDLSDGHSLLVHQKMTGHFLIGYWVLDDGCWKPKQKGVLQEKVNTYIHLMFWLSGNLMLALSDVRKFAKVELWKTNELLNSEEFKNLGPEPLDKKFTLEKFKDALKNKKSRLRFNGDAARQGKTLLRPSLNSGLRKGKIKQILMNPEIIAGIGNIYSSEILWQARIHPEKNIAKLSEKELKLLYQAIKKVLKLGVKLGGESFSDYRRVDGSKGDFDTERKVYQKEGQKCSRCGAKIKRIKLGGRSAFFCPNCQR